LLERIAGAATGSADLVFGRNRLTQVFSQGRQAGLLTDVQSRFLTGLLSVSGEAIEQTMTPADRIFGLRYEATRAEMLEHARRLALTEIVLDSQSRPGEWTQYVRVAELAVSDRPISNLVRPLPRFTAGQAKLEVLLALRTAGESLGAVDQDGVLIGIANERGLVESVFRAGRPLAVAPTAG
jgi:CBS domain containing-hemolysin-like protein